MSSLESASKESQSFIDKSRFPVCFVTEVESNRQTSTGVVKTFESSSSNVQ